MGVSEALNIFKLDIKEMSNSMYVYVYPTYNKIKNFFYPLL